MNGQSENHRILVVGLLCLDVCNYVEKYPNEDTDNRVFEQRSCLGGNASNNMSVLKQLNNYSEMIVVLPENDPIIEKELLKNPVNTSKCIRRPNFDIPISTTLISLSTGSRTIFHYRGNLIETKFEEFIEKIPHPEDYSWIHFEVEFEKVRPSPWLEKLIPYADVIFMSKDYARSKGWTTKIDAVTKMFHEVCTHKPTVICPWADQGCAAVDNQLQEIISVDGYHPENVIDTLAAGDCFIATAIHFLDQKKCVKEALELATKVAGLKVGQKGLMNLPLDFLQ